ncbi:MAG TPA: hypothetical protein VN737_04310 [Bryobacteraceae bacterium]|nr:hypothetical protein [Bryobacteraceae bacterium]
MAQISITIGQKNGSAFTAEVNEDGTMLSVHSEYKLNVMGSQFTHAKDWLAIHADNIGDLLALADAIKAAVCARVPQPIESEESYEASAALLERRSKASV